MAQVINTNLASLNTQRNLNSSQAGTNQALQRLSSGLRINSAKDDAAGLAISTRFESQIKGLGVAIRNAGDGVSLAQTAEGALGSMTDNLQRVRELALQAANGTNSAADREALQAEAALLIEEIGRVSTGANFNGVNLLDGSLKTSFQVGANAGETISVSIGKLTADTLGVSSKNGVSATGSSNALGVGDLVINGVTVGASRASDDTSSFANAAASSISKAAAINRVSAQSGVTAIVDANVVAGSSMTAAAITGGSVTLNDTTILVDTTGNAASSRASVVSAINAQSALTGITAVDSGDDALGVSLVAADGRNITVSFAGGLSAANTGLAAPGTSTGGVTLVANSGVSTINISGANTANAGVAGGSYTAGVSTVSSSGQVAGAASLATAAELNAGEFAAGFDAAGFDFSEVTSTGTAAVISGAVAVFDFTEGTVAAVTGSVDVTALAYPLDLSGVGDDIEFTVGDGTTVDTITLDHANYADVDALLADIQVQITGNVIVSVDDDGFLVFTNTDGVGAGNDVEVTGVTNSIDLGIAAGATTTAGANDASATFTLTVGTTDYDVTLDQDYTNELGLVNAINTQIAGSGFQASFVGGDLTFTEIQNQGATVTLSDVAGGGAASLATLDDETDTGAPVINAALSFDISVGGGAARTITINDDLTGAGAMQALADEINLQLQASPALGVSASVIDNELVFTSTATGALASVEITNVEAEAATLAAVGLDNLEGSVTGVAQSAAQFNNLDDGDLVINGVSISGARAADDTASYSAASSSSKEASGISIAAAINRASDSTGVTAAVSATQVVGSTASTAGSGTATLYINGVDVSLTASADADSNRASAVSQINAVSGQTGVIAEDNGSSLTLTAADGRNIVMALNTQGGATAANFGLGGVGEADFSTGLGGVGLARANVEATTTYSTVTLSSAGTIEVSGGINGNAAVAGLGLEQGSFGGAVSGQFLTQVDISTQKGATDALAAIDNALNSVNAARADLGAVQNRFEATISNLEVNSENLSAANSRIRDADFAAEAANLARSQVLQQAGISILAQANASGEQVLSLLR